MRSAVFDKAKIAQTKLKLLQLAASTGRGDLASTALWSPEIVYSM
jgi:hypothetical protein